jgi:hypothetical protein
LRLISIRNHVNFQHPASSFLSILFGAFSRFPLYLFCYGLRFAPAATKKDAAAIGARCLSLFQLSQLTTKFVILKRIYNDRKQKFWGENSPPKEGWQKFERIFDGVVFNSIIS